MALFPITTAGVVTSTAATAVYNATSKKYDYTDGYVVIDGTESLTKKGTTQQKNLTFTTNDLTNDPILTGFIEAHLSSTSSSTMENVKFADGTESGGSTGTIPSILAIACLTSNANDIKTYVSTVEISAIGDEAAAADKYTRFTKDFKCVEWTGSSAITLTSGIYQATGNFDSTYGGHAATANATHAKTANAKELWLAYKA